MADDLLKDAEEKIGDFRKAITSIIHRLIARVRELEAEQARRTEYDERCPDPRGYKYLNPDCSFSGCQYLVVAHERDKLRTAIRNAGFSVMETSGDWSIHDVGEHAKRDEERTTEIIARNADLEAENARLRSLLERCRSVVKPFDSFSQLRKLRWDIDRELEENT